MRRIVTVAAVVCSVVAVGTPVTPRAVAAGDIVATIDIAGPAGSGRFGTSALVLSNGNFVVTDPYFDFDGQADVGAVHLFNGVTNQLISTLHGSKANDHVGNRFPQEVGNGNVVVKSPEWDNGGATDAGAITWVNGATGLTGAVSAANSLVGSSTNDRLGDVGVYVLSSRNFLAATPMWDNGGTANAGAVTWGSGASGVSGPITAGNSIVGSTTDDRVGSFPFPLTNGNVVIASRDWDRGGTVNAGAVTWMSGTAPTVGVVSIANSVVGSTADDSIGNFVAPLTQGNYVIESSLWDGVAVNTGAVTWRNGSMPTSGTIDAGNSLIGSTTSDSVNLLVYALKNGNYVVAWPAWNRGAITDAGAVTWGSGTSGVSGIVSAANSLVGSTMDDIVGSAVAPLTNGNYVAYTEFWDHGSDVNAGAATWANGATGLTGDVSTANSMYGNSADDRVSSEGVIPSSNGNYIVLSPRWGEVPKLMRGAVTWGDGAIGTTGVVNGANSWIGAEANDQVGYDSARVLANGHFVFGSPKWDNGAAVDAGASTWMNGAIATAGIVGVANSIVGTATGDVEGGSNSLRALSNGNYIVASPRWNDGATVDVGAVTWASGTGGTAGPVSTGNSITGSKTFDQVGSFMVPLQDGNAVVNSYLWDNAAIADAGALTWMSGTGPTAARVSPQNSIVGSNPNDQIGSGVAFALPDGGLLGANPSWDNGASVDAGAVVYVRQGSAGPVTTANALLGATPMDPIGVGPNVPTALGALIALRPGENKVTLFFLPTKPNFVSLAPGRLADTRPGFATVDGVGAGSGQLPAHSTLEVQVAGRANVATNAVAAALNVTAVDAAGNGFVTVWPCSEPRPTASSLNTYPGSTVPNAVLTKLGTGGKVCVFVSQPMHIVVDVNGYFPTTSTFAATNPARLLDTRSGEVTFDGQAQGGGERPADSVLELQVAGRGGVPANASSAALNVTVTESAAPGFLTAYPCGQPRPTASNLNYVQGSTVANLAVVKLGTDGKVCLYTQSATHLVVDVTGSFPFLTSYAALNPARLLETHAGLTTIDGAFNALGLIAGGTTIPIQTNGRGGVPLDAETVVLNVTVTEPGGPGFVTAYPCGIAPPLASNLNFVAGQTVANAALVKVGTGGTICLFTSQPSHLVVDVGGYFPASSS